VAERLAGLLVPADGLAADWAKRVRQSTTTAPGDEVFLAVTQALLDHLESGGRLLCAEVADLSVADLTLLRRLGHERIASDSVDDAAVPGLLTALDDAVDALIVECTEGRIRHLELDALIDPLTGAGNRRALERDLQMWVAQAVRYDHDLSLVMIDLDGLKAVNDVQGHDAGDALLRQLASSFIAQLRAGDGFYRVGGDEFIALLPHTDRMASEAFVERVRPDAPAFTAGVASAPADGSGPTVLLDVADRRLLDHRGTRRKTRKTADVVEAPLAPTGTRSDDAVIVASVTTIISIEATSVEVALRQGGNDRTGSAAGPPHSAEVSRIAAIATLDALQRLGLDVQSPYVETAEARRVGEHEVVTVMVWTRLGEVEVLGTGSAVVRRGTADAAARAVIQAIVPALPPRQIIQV
jgi:diguanylate cyclase (GGDEF)-like protein